MKITINQINTLKKYIPTIETLVESDDIYELESALDQAIIEFGMDDKQDFLTPVGVELQKIYDDIYYQNGE